MIRMDLGFGIWDNMISFHHTNPSQFPLKASTFGWAWNGMEWNGPICRGRFRWRTAQALNNNL